MYIYLYIDTSNRVCFIQKVFVKTHPEIGSETKINQHVLSDVY